MTHFSTELERKLSEKLQESRHFIELVANGTPDILYVLDLEKKKVVFINKRAIDILGADHDLFAIVHPDDRTLRQEQLQACRKLKDYEVKESDFRMRVKDGSWHWFRVRDMAFKRRDNGSVLQVIGIAQDVHTQKSAERTLKAVFDAVPAGIHLYKAVRDEKNKITDFELLMINRVGEMVVGKNLEAGARLSTLGPDMQQGFITRLAKTVRSGEPGEEIVHYSGKDFSHWHLVKFRKFEDGVILTHTDITDIKRAEDELRESKHFIERVTNTSPDFIFIFDVKAMKVVYANDRVIDLLGPDKEYLFEESGGVFRDKLYPEDAERRLQHIANLAKLRDNETAEIELRIQTPGGEHRWFTLREKVFRRDAEGKVLQTIGVGQDIHEQKSAEERIKAQNYFITKVAALTPDIISVYDFTLGRHIYVNREISRDVAISSEKVRESDPASLYELIHPDDRKQTMAFVEKLRTASDAHVAENTYRMRHPSGKWLWFYSRGIVFQRDEKGTVTQYMAVTQDISALKNAEDGKKAGKSKSRFWKS